MDRRRFIKTLFLAGGGLMADLPRHLSGVEAMAAAQEPETLKFAQIADVHMVGFTTQGESVCPRLPTYAWWAISRRYDLMGYLLPIALQQIHDQFDPQFIIFSGDLVENGNGPLGQGDLRQFKQVAEEHAGDLSRHFVYGNHDGPQAAWKDLFGPLNWTFDLGRVRFVGLNSGSMDQEAEQASSLRALRHLAEAIATADGRRLVVMLHQWIYPTDTRGYSMARAEKLKTALEEYPAAVAVLSGHYHAGRHDVVNGIHYFTAKAFCEPPLCYYTYELTPTELICTEHCLKPSAKAFVPAEVLHMRLREFGQKQ